MDVVNSTDDDAKLKVLGGPSGTGKKDMEWDLPRGHTLTIPSPTSPCVIHFSIEAGEQTVTPAVKSLKLTRGENGYVIQVTRRRKK